VEQSFCPIYGEKTKLLSKIVKRLRKRASWEESKGINLESERRIFLKEAHVVEARWSWQEMLNDLINVTEIMKF
jgi:hypothetical protein